MKRRHIPFLLLCLFLCILMPYITPAASKKPGKPTITTLKLKSASSVKLAWSKAKRADRYEVYYSLNGGKYKKLKALAKLSYTHKGLKAGSKVAYKVRAVNKTGKSSFSKAKKIRIPSPTATPTPVPTATPTMTPTPVPTATPTMTPTPVPTATPTATPTPVPTATPTSTPTPVPTATPTPQPASGKAVILYFSADNTKDPDAVSSATPMVGGVTSVRWIAELIHEVTGADLVPIIPSVDYPLGYNELADYAKEEGNRDARPAFESLGVNLASYDTVFLGYPVWWYDAPMIIETLLDSYDFSGKTLIPFNTHGGSSDAGTYSLLKRREPGARVLDGMPLQGRNAGTQSARNSVLQWLQGLDLK